MCRIWYKCNCMYVCMHACLRGVYLWARTRVKTYVAITTPTAMRDGKKYTYGTKQEKTASCSSTMRAAGWRGADASLKKHKG